MKRLALILFVLFVSLFASAAQADFTNTVSYAYSQATSIKVTSPANFKIKVQVGGQEKEDTIPAIISLPDQDAFVPVTIIAPDGKSWSGKIEVKAKQQATIAFTYTAQAAAPAAAAPARKFIGKVTNLTNTCDATHQGTMHFEFLDAGGTKVYEVDVEMNTFKPNVDIPAGSYDVRVFKKTAQGPIYQTTSKYTISQDGWNFEWSCKR